MRAIFSASCCALLLMIVGMTAHAATLTQALTITGQGTQSGANVVQAITDHGTPANITHGNGTQKCVWPFTQVQDYRGVTASTVQAGHTVVGYIHSANNGDNTPMFPQAVTDDAGDNITLSPVGGVLWSPYPEDIGFFLLPSPLPNNVTTLTFDYTQYPNSGNTVLDFCDVGFVEFAGVSGINTTVTPFNASNVQNPSLTISPTLSSLIFTLGATNTVSDGSDFLTSGYTIAFPNEESSDGIGVWTSNSVVNAGTNTLTWVNSFYNSDPCEDGHPAGSTGCTTVVGAIALTASGVVPTSVTPTNGTVADNATTNTVITSLGCTMSDGSACPASATFAVASDPKGWVKVAGTQLQSAINQSPGNDGLVDNITLSVTANGHTATSSYVLTVQPAGQIPAGCNANGLSPNGTQSQYPNGTGTATLQWNTCFQVVDGFGAGEPVFGTLYTQAEANMLYSLNGGGIGLSFERINCNPLENGDSTCVPGSLIDCPNASLVAANGAKVYGMFTQGPSTMLITGSPPTLIASDYQAYADYMTNFVKGVQSQCGVKLWGLSIQNEPQDGWMAWPNDVHGFILNNLEPDFQANNISLNMTPEESCCENFSQYDDAFVAQTYADPNTAKFINYMFFHAGAGQVDQAYPVLTPGQHGWQTEACSNGSDINQAVGCAAAGIASLFALGNVNAWEWQEGAPWSTSDFPQLFDINGVPQVALYMMGNFSKFVRPGWYEFGANFNPTGNTLILFFRAPTGKNFAVVAVNQDLGAESVNFNFNGFTSPSVTPVISSSTLSLAQQSNVTAGSGFSYSIPAQSVVTFTGTAN